MYTQWLKLERFHYQPQMSIINSFSYALSDVVEPTEPWWSDVKVVLNVCTLGWSMNSFKVCGTISEMPWSGIELIIIAHILCVSIRMYMHWILKNTFRWCCFLAIMIKLLKIYLLWFHNKDCRHCRCCLIFYAGSYTERYKTSMKTMKSRKSCSS